MYYQLKCFFFLPFFYDYDLWVTILSPTSLHFYFFSTSENRVLWLWLCKFEKTCKYTFCHATVTWLFKSLHLKTIFFFFFFLFFEDKNFWPILLCKEQNNIWILLQIFCDSLENHSALPKKEPELNNKWILWPQRPFVHNGASNQLLTDLFTALVFRRKSIARSAEGN